MCHRLRFFVLQLALLVALLLLLLLPPLPPLASGCLPLSAVLLLLLSFSEEDEGERGELCCFEGESLDPQNLIFPAFAVFPDNPEM